MSSKYRVTLTIGHDEYGKPIRKQFSAKTKKAARKKRDDYIFAMKTGETPDQKSVTFKQWAEKWIDTYKDGYVSEVTLNGTYIPITNTLSDYFGNTPLALIKPVDCQKCLMSFSDRSLSYLSKIRMVLKAIFESAADNDLINTPPTNQLKLPIKEQEKTRRVFTYEQAQKAIDFAKRHEYGIGAFIILNSGLRQSELMGLIPSRDFNLPGRCLTLHETVVDINGRVVVRPYGKSRNAMRSIPLTEECVEVLNIALKVFDPYNYIFQNKFGKAMSPKSWARNHFKKYMDDLITKYPDMPRLTPHELRHTYGTLLYKAGTDIYTLSKIMGHASVDVTTKVYVHDDFDDIQHRVVFPEQKGTREGTRLTPSYSGILDISGSDADDSKH